MANVIYMTQWQLGGTGRPHRKLSAAITDMKRSEARARKGGDCQSIDIIAIEDGCQRPLTDAEEMLIAAG